MIKAGWEMRLPLHCFNTLIAGLFFALWTDRSRRELAQPTVDFRSGLTDLGERSLSQP
jgi:hypothetical protein